MNDSKKFLTLIATILIVISLQFNTTLTKGMANGFSLATLTSNIFIQDANARNEPCDTWGCPGGWDMCAEINGTIWCFHSNNLTYN